MSWSGLPESVEKYIIPEPNSGCWIWLGGLRSKQDFYGGLHYQGKSYRTHRFAYLFLRGAIKPGLAIDHLCRNKICCNPNHLEPVTWKDNIYRGEGVAPINVQKTVCPQGHPYDVENTYTWNKQRFCRTCSRKYKAAYVRKRGRRQR